MTKARTDPDLEQEAQKTLKKLATDIASFACNLHGPFGHSRGVIWGVLMLAVSQECNPYMAQCIHLCTLSLISAHVHLFGIHKYRLRSE